MRRRCGTALEVLCRLQSGVDWCARDLGLGTGFSHVIGIGRLAVSGFPPRSWRKCGRSRSWGTIVGALTDLHDSRDPTTSGSRTGDTANCVCRLYQGRSGGVADRITALVSHVNEAQNTRPREAGHRLCCKYFKSRCYALFLVERELPTRSPV
jgi:hypothetical protein